MTSERLVSLDILRGATMVFLCLEVLRLPLGVQKFPDSTFWQIVSTQSAHAPWTGMTLWDLIQPAFMFMVGVALPWSVANRRASGQSSDGLWRHALWRCVALILLGLMLVSLDQPQTQFDFTNVLTQIGLGYTVVFALAWTTRRVQLLAGLTILLLTYLAFVLYPAVDYASHWGRHDNVAAAFDLWFINLFPNAEMFTGNPGSYTTLNFVPAIVTMLAGVLTGETLRSADSPLHRASRIAGWSLLSITVGLILDQTGICPSIKRLWTPAWVLISSGVIGGLVAATYWLTDIRGIARPFELLRIVGLNSLALYVVLYLWDPFLSNLLLTHLSWNLFSGLTETTATFAARLGEYVLLILFCVWLHKRRIYLRV
jgi:heparan-alpha-glucosaminide N-acetyltransferase